MRYISFILILIHSASANCQTIALYEEEKEISTIIFNRILNNSKKFKLEIKQFNENRKLDKSVLRYVLHNDTTIEVREKGGNQIFRIKDSIFIPINCKNESINEDDLTFFSYPDYLRRSILIYYTDCFYSGDTVTYIKDRLESGKLKPADVLVEGKDTINTGLQVILKKEGNQIYLVRNLFQNGKWYHWYDLIISTTNIGKSGWETTIKGKKLGVEYLGYEREMDIEQLYTTLIEYNRKGLIKSITVKKMKRIMESLEITVLKIY